MAAISDVKTGKISNKLILSGYMLGIVFSVLKNGPPGVIVFIVKVSWPIVLFFIFFYIRSLGAGDIKLFSVLSPFVDSQCMARIIILSLFIGAGISCHRILINNEIQERLINIKYYIESCIYQKKILKYPTINKESSYINFAVCILFGYICTVIWSY